MDRNERASTADLEEITPYVEDAVARTDKDTVINTLVAIDKKVPGTEAFPWSPLNCKRRRDKVEAKLEQIDLMTYLSTGRAEQTVPLMKIGDTEVTVGFRSLTRDDIDWLRWWSEQEEKNKRITKGESVKANYELVMCVGSLNGNPLPELWEMKEGVRVLSLDKAQAARDELGKLPELLEADLHIQLQWFKERLMKVHTAALIENF